MTLRCEQLEPRTPAVALQWVFDPDPWLLEREAEIRAAGDSLAARLTRPDTDTYRIDVQTGPQPGALADAYPVYPPNSLTPHSGVIRFDTSRPWYTEFDFVSVVLHETSHALDVKEHNPDPDSLMYEFAPRVGFGKNVTYTDLPLFERAGWEVAAITPFPAEYEYVQVLGVGVQDGDNIPDGLAFMTEIDRRRAYPDYVLGPGLPGSSWAYFPPGTSL